MKQRCSNPKASKYNIYGGRGIAVCYEWKSNFEVFKNWALQNGYSESLSIDRIDSDKGYYPENCRWADCFEQNNNLRSNHLITYNNKTLSINQWARELKISKKTLSERIRRGWNIQRAFETPVLNMEEFNDTQRLPNGRYKKNTEHVETRT